MIGMADFGQLVYLYRVQRNPSNTVSVSSQIMNARYARNDDTLGWCLCYTKRLHFANFGKFYAVFWGDSAPNLFLIIREFSFFLFCSELDPTGILVK